jgi:hypothetical protein
MMNMKHYLYTLFALALTCPTATQARATVAWSSIASGCVLQSAGATLALIDAAYGTVTFAPNKAGDIKLTCPVQSLHQVAANAVNNFEVTFYNNHGFDGGVNHCYIQADLLRSNLNNIEAGWDISRITTAGRPFTGRQTLDTGVPEKLDFDTSYYWVDIQLHRDLATATCDPLLVGTYLQAVDIIFRR